MTKLDDEDLLHWQCMVAEESHKHTESKFSGKKLTGEPSGRQIWGKSSASDPRNGNEDLIQELEELFPARSRKMKQKNNNKKRQQSQYKSSRYR